MRLVVAADITRCCNMGGSEEAMAESREAPYGAGGAGLDPGQVWRHAWACRKGYVAMLERGQRQPSDALRRRLARVLQLPATSLPTAARRATVGRRRARCRTCRPWLPGVLSPPTGSAPKESWRPLLLDALAAEALDPRTAEALPWLLLTFPDLDWDWLLPQVKQRDLQNRLGYVVSLARNVADLQGLDVARVLEEREALARAESSGPRGRLREELPHRRGAPLAALQSPTGSRALEHPERLRPENWSWRSASVALA